MWSEWVYAPMTPELGNYVQVVHINDFIIEGFVVQVNPMSGFNINNAPPKSNVFIRWRKWIGAEKDSTRTERTKCTERTLRTKMPNFSWRSVK